MMHIKKNIEKRKRHLINPFVLLSLLVVVLLALQRGDPYLTPFEILIGGILTIICILGIMKFFTINASLPRPLFYLLTFAFWAVLNVVLAIAWGVELEWWLRRFFPVFFFPMMALISFIEFRTLRTICTIYMSLMLIGAIVILINLLELRFVNIGEIIDLQLLRQYGGGYFGAFSLSLALPLLFMRRHYSSFWKILIWLVVIISILGLILSFTRTFWISTIISLFFMAYLIAKVKQQNYVRLLGRIAVVGAISMIVFMLLAPITVRSFVISRVTGIPAAFLGLSFQDRVYEAKGIFHTMLENPLTFATGSGLGAKFTFYSVNPFSWGGIGWMSIDFSHNYYLYLLFTTGIIGLSLFLAVWIKLFSSIKNSFIRTRNIIEFDKFLLIGIATVIVNLLVASLTASPLISIKWAVYFGLLVGLALNLIRLPYKRQEHAIKKKLF